MVAHQVSWPHMVTNQVSGGIFFYSTIALGERSIRPPEAGHQPQHRVQNEHPGGAEGGHRQAAGPRPERRRRHEQGGIHLFGLMTQPLFY